ncbi:glycoside hydrolase family 16 protein [Modestobacter sp. NPDC049651]|uniref:glycoside hydrolase family 16 protein n=1 Tax=unclassified Modestobacter TaxID=2643866 RepID=UPI0033FF2E20
MSPQKPAARRPAVRTRVARRLVPLVGLLLVLAACTGGGGGGSSDDLPRAGDDGAAPTPTTMGQRQGWTPRGGDEFDAGRLDPTKWRLYGGPGANDVGWRDPSAVSVADGMLTITAQGDVSGGLAWKAQPATTYGKWEFRARVEAGTGYAPAILLWPDSDVWPEDGEVDVMEIPAGDRQVNHTTVHFGADDMREESMSAGDFTQWHTYAVDWQRDRISVYLDGEPVFETTNPAAVPHGPMHLAIQLDVGPQGTWIPAPDETTPASVRLDVDWVRMYR